MIDALTIEENQIKLKLEEIQLKKRLLEIQTERQTKKQNKITTTITYPQKRTNKTILQYSPSSKKRVMRIADINPDGCILIYGQKGSKHIAKKYNMKSLKWIKDKLPKFVKTQNTKPNFWHRIADQYNRKFQVKISHNTMEKLCYLVDSGKADHWFQLYDEIKEGHDIQVKL